MPRQDQSNGCTPTLLFFLLAYLMLRFGCGCGVASLQGWDLDTCGTHPITQEPIYCACIRACPGEHQCTLHVGTCDPLAKDRCPVIEGYSPAPEAIWELADRPCTDSPNHLEIPR